jgi:hypothetical protein
MVMNNSQDVALPSKHSLLFLRLPASWLESPKTAPSFFPVLWLHDADNAHRKLYEQLVHVQTGILHYSADSCRHEALIVTLEKCVA